MRFLGGATWAFIAMATAMMLEVAQSVVPRCATAGRPTGNIFTESNVEYYRGLVHSLHCSERGISPPQPYIPVRSHSTTPSNPHKWLRIWHGLQFSVDPQETSKDGTIWSECGLCCADDWLAWSPVRQLRPGVVSCWWRE